MIPDIGIIIAAYVITRCVAMLTKANPLARILAVLTILITLVCMLDLIAHGTAWMSRMR